MNIFKRGIPTNMAPHYTTPHHSAPYTHMFATSSTLEDVRCLKVESGRITFRGTPKEGDLDIGQHEGLNM